MAQRELNLVTPSRDAAEVLRLPRGFLELDGELTAAVKAVEYDWFAQTRLRGMRPLWVPPVGFASTFNLGHGAAVGRNYTFPDRKGRLLTLVSDSLPAVLRSVAARGALETRVGFCSPIFRYVSGVKRRHFHQLGCSELSDPSGGSAELPGAVSRCLSMLLTFFVRHGLGSVEVDVYDLDIWYELLSSTHERAGVRALLYELKSLPVVAWRARLAAAGAAGAALRWAELLQESGDVRRDAMNEPQLAERLALHFERSERLLEVCAGLGGVRARFAPTVLRSLEFQDALGFQVIVPASGARIADGGSYGEFASHFLGRDVRCVSAAVGLEMLAELGSHAPGAGGVLVRLSSPASAQLALRLVNELRARDVRVWESAGRARMARELGTAEREGFDWFVNLGDREGELGTLSVRARGQEPVALRLDEFLERFPRTRDRAYGLVEQKE